MTMSKIGKLPISIPESVTITIDGGTLRVSGPKGTLTQTLHPDVLVHVDEGKARVSLTKRSSEKYALFGLTRATIANMVEGVTQGFVKKLELSGVGYRANLLGENLTLLVGFSHPVTVQAVPGITFEIAENVITVSGVDKGLVGEVAARIRSIRPPEPYKGKGIAYVGERIRRKAGKAAKTVGVK